MGQIKRQASATGFATLGSHVVQAFRLYTYIQAVDLQHGNWCRLSARPVVCVAVWLALVAAPRATSAAAASEDGVRPTPPNVVLLVTDDQGYFDLGCHGNPVLKTPHLDRLYVESTRLTNFHVDPLGSPTRAALMTGRYAGRAGVWATAGGRSLLGEGDATMADVFLAAGYRTGIFGKWHLGDNYPFRPQDRGFEQTLVIGGGGIGQTPDAWGNDGVDDTYCRNGKPERCSGYATDVFFAEACKFIEANRQEPFFCYLATSAPHEPYLVDDRYSKPYRDQGIADPQAAFYGMIAQIDENVGRLMALIDRLRLRQRTIIVFLSDNGTAAGHFGTMRGGKASAYEGGHRVPCFLRWPDHLAAGRDIDRLAAHFDLLPTLIDLCQLKPRAKLMPFDGMSLVPILAGDDTAAWPERTVVVHAQQREVPVKWNATAVISQRWRLVGRNELYDMEADPGQTTNVAAAHADVLDSLYRAYERWWAESFEPIAPPWPLVIGSDHENPTRLSAFDWSGTEFGTVDSVRVPLEQSQIRDDALYLRGYWPVRVAQDGTYRFALRRYPREHDGPLGATDAKLKVGVAEARAAVADGAAEIVFDLWLRAGKTRLETELLDKKTRRSRSAYYVYIERLP